ncbi:MAG: hypothetical protein SFU21_03400 [Flavihumibacter sp.]|nr:hypothetical protein [Flavihumibacter sp.]
MMQLTIEPAELKATLKRLATVIKAHTLLPILDFVKIDVSADNAAVATASSIETTIITGIDLQSNQAGTVLLDYRKLQKIADVVKEAIQVTVAEEAVTITSGIDKWQLGKPADAATYPATNYDATEEQLAVPAGLFAALRIASSFCAGPKERHDLQNCAVYLQAERLIVAGTNSGIAYFESFACNTDAVKEHGRPLLLPADMVANLPDVDAVLHINNRKLVAETLNTTVILTQADVPPPDLRQLLSLLEVWNVFVDKDALLAALEKIFVFTAPFYLMRMSIADNEMLVTYCNADLNESAESAIVCESQLEPVTVAFNATQLKHVLSRLPGDTVEFAIKGPDKGVFLRPRENNNITALIMPIQL